MKIEVHNRCSDYTSYRAARVKSLFNAESGCNFDLTAELPIDDSEWRIGLIVGPSGSGKTSMGRQIFGAEALYQPEWPDDRPIVDAITPDGTFHEVTAVLAAVGLGSVPTWLRPYAVLSNGEQFRANLARVIAEAPARVVIDEFTSVVDRQIAKVGALAFQKAWRRTSGQAVLLSCHYDIVEWVEPDWVFDTQTGTYSGRGLWRRPSLELELWETNWRYWPFFEPHHYLRPPHAVAATNYVGTINGQLVAHAAVAPRPGLVEARICRLVVMPEWQGIGIGSRFLNAISAMWLRGDNRYHKPMRMLIHTSHPGLCISLRRSTQWTQLSAVLYGTNRAKSMRSLQRSMKERSKGGYGGHFRAIQGFRYRGG